MFEKLKLPFAAIGIAAILCLSVVASNADAQRVIPSMGIGPYEVFMFSDYFCPPCKQIDTKAETLMKELLETGKVKITFVDVPFHSATPIYAKYYLYAVNINADSGNVFHVRRILFDAAQAARIQKEDALIAYLKEKKIFWKVMDEKAIFPLLSSLIKENKVDQTPTCVIRYPLAGEKKYVGDIEIWDGLMQLKTTLKAGRK
jgi:thiol:disulfide interchange protein DsbA